MRIIIRSCLVAMLFTVSARMAGATTLVVRPDGSGDYPTIQAAVDAAVNGDIIQLTPGNFIGNGNTDVTVVSKSLRIESSNQDPLTCTIEVGGDAQHQRRAFDFLYCPNAALTGITIENGYTPITQGGGVCGLHCGTMTIDRCIFRNNSSQVGGGIYVGNTPLFISNCVFDHNQAFRDNHSGAAICLSVSAMTADHRTFVDNIGSGTVTSINGSSAALTSSIVAFTSPGCALFCVASSASVVCCDLYGNAGGDYTNCIAPQAGMEGNISLDPRFCSDGSYGLAADSPCAPENNPAHCLMGARPVGCNDVPNLTFLSPAPGNVQVFQRNPFRIEWDDTDPDDNAILSLYRNPGCEPEGDLVIAPALLEDPEGTGNCYPQGEGDCYDWNTSPVPPGVYHIRGSMIDGHHREVWRCSEGTVEILPPSVDLTCGSAPRPNSGQPASPWNIGQEIEFEMEVENRGSLSAGPFTVGFYLGTSADDYSDRRRFELISSLEPASSTLPQWRISFHVRDVGERYLNVWIDDGNEVGEGSHEENNRCSYGPFFIQNPTVDQNKLGPVVGGTGHVLFYEDRLANECHDPGEPFLAHDPGGYLKTADNSCWMAAACNLLEYENWPHPYTIWLREGCGTAPYSGPWGREILPPCGSSMTLDDVGYPHWALRAAGAVICGPIFTATPLGGAWNRDPIAWCSQRLADGHPVVLSVFWGQPRDDGRVGRRTQDSGRHALTLWGLDRDGQTVILTDSDDQDAGPWECAFTYSGEDWILRDAWDGTDLTIYGAVSLAGAEGCRSDLACDPVQIAPYLPPPGTPATLSTRVRNLGESLAPASVTAMRMDGLPLAQCPFISTPDLYIDQEFPISCGIEVWDGQEHLVVACADAHHEVAEADEDNNCPEVLVESDVDAVAGAPDQVTLGPVHPNPAQRLATCQLGIPPQLGGSEVELTVYDASGAAVRTVPLSTAKPGWSTVTWDGLRNDGHRVPSGVYLLRVRIGKEVRSRSVIVSH